MAANAPASVIHADQCCLPIALSAVILNWAIAQNIIAEVMTAIGIPGRNEAAAEHERDDLIAEQPKHQRQKRESQQFQAGDEQAEPPHVSVLSPHKHPGGHRSEHDRQRDQRLHDLRDRHRDIVERHLLQRREYGQADRAQVRDDRISEREHRQPYGYRENPPGHSRPGGTASDHPRLRRRCSKPDSAEIRNSKL